MPPWRPKLRPDKREFRTKDCTDINIVSTLLPYCDAMFVDNECRALLQDIPKSHALPHQCLIFSPNTGADFIGYLAEIRDSVSPEHLHLVEEVYGPDPLKPQKGIYGVGKRGVEHED